MGTLDKDDDDEFVTTHADRKQHGKTKRKQSKRNSRDGERRLHRVDAKKDRWHFDPKQPYSEEDDG